MQKTAIVNISHAAIIFVLINCQEHSHSPGWILRLSNSPSLVQPCKKCLAVPHLFLPVFISFLCMRNLSLKVIANPTYCNLQH